jgi:flagellar protein FliO/FliZ
MRTLHAYSLAVAAAIFGCLLTAPVAFAANGENTKLNLSDDAPAASAAQGASAGSLGRTIFGLLVVLAIIYGLHWILKKAKHAKESASKGEGLATIASLQLGTNRSLHLVRAGREIVLLGAAEHAITPIRRYSEAEARQLGLLEGAESAPQFVAGLETAPAPAAAPKGFIDSLRAKTVVK